MKSMNRRDFLKYSGAGLAGLTMAIHFPFLTPRRALAATGAWTFGVMADTQWQSSTEPATCAVSIINALNAQFINHGVRYVIQVGDLVDSEGTASVNLQTRADAASALYSAGIGFFPLRGNHEASQTSANKFVSLWPQSQGNGSNIFGATNFNSPAIAGLTGLSYSFDMDNVRSVLIDQFTRTDGSGSNNNNAVLDQTSWIDSRISSRPADSHAFIFSHKNLIGQNHKDVLFGSSLTANAAARDAFITSLQNNGARYQIGGHDHMHHRSLVKTSDGTAEVGQIICSSNSYKFYTPQSGDDGRETPLEQELYTIGYYIYTVDGPRLYVDFYSASNGLDYGPGDISPAPSVFNFYLRESFGYSLNGKQFKIAHGQSYTSVQDTFNTTTAKILGGTNGNTETDYLGRALSKTVNTGWLAGSGTTPLISDVLSLWGMADNLSLYNASLTGLLPNADESKQSDTFALSMSYDPAVTVNSGTINQGQVVALSTRDANGNWVNAVNANFGGRKRFILGAWNSAYPLGTYGVDPATCTAWAVINSAGSGQFAVTKN